MTAEERAARSARLHELMNNPDVKDAVASVEADLVETWRTCFDAAERDRLWHTLQAFGLLTGKLTNWSTSDLQGLRKGR
jgi:hypothetical protein